MHMFIRSQVSLHLVLSRALSLKAGIFHGLVRIARYVQLHLSRFVAASHTRADNCPHV